MADDIKYTYQESAINVQQIAEGMQAAQLATEATAEHLVTIKDVAETISNHFEEIARNPIVTTDMIDVSKNMIMIAEKLGKKFKDNTKAAQQLVDAMEQLGHIEQTREKYAKLIAQHYGTALARAKSLKALGVLEGTPSGRGRKTLTGKTDKPIGKTDKEVSFAVRKATDWGKQIKGIAESQTGVKLTLSGIILMLIGVFLFWRLYDLTPEKKEAIKAKLKELDL